MTAERRRLAAYGIAVFVAGAVLLGVEIAASRVLAPFFGNSLFVWGALIGVVLTGLAVGYWAGGALADRLPSPLLMLGALAAGAAAVLAIPLVDDPVLEAVVRWDPGPRADPLVAAVLLFGLPSVVLATATPIAVRLVTRSVATLGRSAGRLFAVSTAGSIAGTFATAFWLVPELGTDQLLAFAAAALFAAATLFALVHRLVVPSAAALAAVAGAAVAAVSLAPASGGTLSGAAARNWSPVYRLQRDRSTAGELDSRGLRVRLRKDSRYHRITVADDQDSRYLRFDNSFQSGMFLKHPFRTRFRYTDFFDLGLAYDLSARNVLFVGLGGGSAPKRFWRDLRDVRIQVAELDPAVVDAARRFFSLPRDPRLRVSVEDGRRYLVRHDERWDMIAIDAFYADAVPFHLTTREFLELVRQPPAAGRRRRHERDRGDRRLRVEALPLLLPHVPLGVPDGRRAPGPRPRRHERRNGAEPDPGRDGGRRAAARLSGGAVARAPRAEPAPAGPHSRDPGPVRARDPPRGRPVAHGRLRADGSAALGLVEGASRGAAGA